MRRNEAKNQSEATVDSCLRSSCRRDPSRRCTDAQSEAGSCLTPVAVAALAYGIGLVEAPGFECTTQDRCSLVDGLRRDQKQRRQLFWLSLLRSRHRSQPLRTIFAFRLNKRKRCGAATSSQPDAPLKSLFGTGAARGRESWIETSERCQASVLRGTSEIESQPVLERGRMPVWRRVDRSRRDSPAW